MSEHVRLMLLISCWGLLLILGQLAIAWGLRQIMGEWQAIWEDWKSPSRELADNYGIAVCRALGLPSRGVASVDVRAEAGELLRVDVHYYGTEALSEPLELPENLRVHLSFDDLGPELEQIVREYIGPEDQPEGSGAHWQA